MKRLTLFAKGNLDLRDTLHALRLGGEVVWNGMGEIVRARHPGWSVRVRHETMTGPQALLEASGEIPAEFAARDLDLGAYPLETQFSKAFYDAGNDVVVLSIQPLVTIYLWRRKGGGCLFMPEGFPTWPAADQAWLRGTFEPLGFVEPRAGMDALEAVIARRRETSDAPILIYNLSAAVPGERLHVHAGFEDILSTRIRRFNLALIELSQRTGISVIDVDGVLARAGADHLKYDAMHLNAEACRLVAEEVVRVLDDLGLFAEDVPA